jgi:hypothetical protein
MKFNMAASGLLLLGLIALASPGWAQGSSHPLDTAGIAKAIGIEGQHIGDMYKVSFPRSDLTVKVGNLVIKPALALVNWAGFVKYGNTAITYGDLVLLDDEINQVISKLEESGIELSALHNHLLHEHPRIMYIHFTGRGDEVIMATGLRQALALTKTPLIATPPGPETKPELATEIERIVGFKGAMGGGVFHIVVPRNDVHVAAMGPKSPAAWA